VIGIIPPFSLSALSISCWIPLHICCLDNQFSGRCGEVHRQAVLVKL